RLGVARDDWRALYAHLTGFGFEKELIVEAGLAKMPAEKESKPARQSGGGDPYDVFRNRLIFPLKDTGGRVVGFSGRSLSKDVEPKYLNSPDTPLFTKSELLYGLDRAKEDIRRKNYSVLVEGQMDLVMSHQAGIRNTVASSGTAFTTSHLGRLKKISPRIVLAFDGDEAGEKAVEKSTITAMGLGMEVKVARTPVGSDPADVIKSGEDVWKDVLRNSLPAIEHILSSVEKEGDSRKRGKLIESRVLPLILLLESAIERSYFVSLVAKRAGLKEDVVWEDLKRAGKPSVPSGVGQSTPKKTLAKEDIEEDSKKTHKELIEERLAELSSWREELVGEPKELDLLEKEEAELKVNLRKEELALELGKLNTELAQAEGGKDQAAAARLLKEIAVLYKEKNTLDGERKVV
ncbi:MAG: toprim domain-containing protein, partial [Parcubacteria group bacterium]